MEVKELIIGEEGLNATLVINGEEIKVGNLADEKEFHKAQAYICTLICDHFFELTKMYADKKGIAIYEVFESREKLDDAFQRYIAEFMKHLIDNAVVQAEANWELFKDQKENPPKPNHYA